MANHGRTGEALKLYREKRLDINRRRVKHAKDAKGGPVFTNGHYGKPSRDNRKRQRAANIKAGFTAAGEKKQKAA